MAFPSESIPGSFASYEVADLGSLTAVGVTSSQATIGVSLCFQIVLSSVGTNAVIRLEGSLDDTNFFNLDQDELDTTLTANGTYGYALNGCPVKFVRVRLVSITGGTPTVGVKVGST